MMNIFLCCLAVETYHFLSGEEIYLPGKYANTPIIEKSIFEVISGMNVFNILKSNRENKYKTYFHFC